MDISNSTIKKIRGLILFTLVILVGLWKIDLVLEALKFLWEIILPFALGGAFAFIINVPMSFFEKKLFHKDTKKRKCARVLSLILTIALSMAVIVMIIKVVVPQLINSITLLARNVTTYIPKIQGWIEKYTNKNQDIMQIIHQMEYNSQSIFSWLIMYWDGGDGSVMDSTLTIAKTVTNAVATFFIAFSFACYILVQKEKLHIQVRKVLFAFIQRKTAEVITEICSFTNSIFTNFLAGQCLEALILGGMFVVSMFILKMPYALLVGILIAFTALIPVFGAFVGCAAGTILIFIVSPRQAIIFVVLFLVLQQIEGNLIYPHVVGNSVGLPSIWVLAAVSVGGKLMGIVGMIVMIPIASVLYALFREYVYLKLKKQKIKCVTAKEVEIYTPEEIEQMKKTFLREHIE